MEEAEWLASDGPMAMLAELRTEGQQLAWNGRPAVSDRKLRLFACACCRRLGLSDRCRRAVDLAERFADGLAPVADLTAACVQEIAFVQGQTPPGQRHNAPEADALWLPVWPLNDADILPGNMGHYLPRAARMGQAPAVQAALLREIIGNPWRPLTTQCPSCLGGGRMAFTRVPDFREVIRRLDDPTRPLTAADLPKTTMGQCTRGRGSGLVPGLDPSWLAWRDGTVPRLAAAVYTERAFTPERLAILADALEEAGAVGPVCAFCGGTGHYPKPPYCGRCGGEGHLVERGILVCPDCNGEGVLPHLKHEGCNGTGRVPHPLLAHLRGPGPHVRGCWAVDTLLGKE